MIIIDTNILVRIIANDEPNQVNLVKNILDREKFYIRKTVILELVWVLGGNRYKYDKKAIESALNKLLCHPNVMVEDILQLKRALHWYAAGIDFDDALHLAAGLGGNEFVTFDTQLIKQAGKIGIPLPMVINPKHKATA